MSIIGRNHIVSGAVGNIKYDPTQTTTKEIRLGRRYTNFRCCLSVTLTAAGVAASDFVQAGIMALIRKMWITIDSDSPIYDLSGTEIRNLQIIETQAVPIGEETLVGNVTKTYKVCFTYRFDKANYAQKSAYGLDLSLVKNVGERAYQPFNACLLNVDWGNINDIAKTSGGMTVTDANLSVEAEELFIPAVGLQQKIDRLVNVAFKRASVEKFTQSGTVEIEIPRHDRSVLLDVIIVKTQNGLVSNFDNNDARVTLKDVNYEPTNVPIHTLKQRVNEDRVFPLPDNVLILNQAGFGNVGNGVSDSVLSENLKLTLPVEVNNGEAGNQHEIHVLAIYTIAPKAF